MTKAVLATLALLVSAAAQAQPAPSSPMVRFDALLAAAEPKASIFHKRLDCINDEKTATDPACNPSPTPSGRFATIVIGSSSPRSNFAAPARLECVIR